MKTTFSSVAIWLLSTASLVAQPKSEMLPAPKPIVEELPPPTKIVEQVPMGPLGPMLPGYFLPNRYAHWNLYAIDKQGYFKPRVILAPQPYYLYNGQPYYFLPVRPTDLSNDPRPR